MEIRARRRYWICVRISILVFGSFYIIFRQWEFPDRRFQLRSPSPQIDHVPVTLPLKFDPNEFGNPCNQITSFDERSPRCVTNLTIPMLTAECPSRLGNQMFSYAILYSIAFYNNRQALMNPKMSDFISKYFQVSMDTLDNSLYKSTDWKYWELLAKVTPHLRHIKKQFSIKFCCWPQTYKYFDELRPRISQEFTFHPHIQLHAQNQLAKANAQFSMTGIHTSTVVGIHIRRTDYLRFQHKERGHLPRIEFFLSAMNYFKMKYPFTIFVVASDNLTWFQKEFQKSSKKNEFLVYYLNGTKSEDGGLDLAVLTKCDHIIFGVGTFGFWAGYLNPGEVIYCSDCITNETLTLDNPTVYGGDYGNFVLPNWKGISRNGDENWRTRNLDGVE